MKRRKNFAKKHPKLVFLFLSSTFLLIAVCFVSVNFRKTPVAEAASYYSIPAAAKSIKKTSFERKFSRTTKLPIKDAKKIKSMQFNGSVNLKRENSFARVVLVDADKNEYLIFDSSSNYSNKLKYEITNYCEETCVLEKAITPKELIVEVSGAEITIKNIGSLEEKKDFLPSIKTKISSQGIAALKKEYFSNQIAGKLSALKKIKTQKKLTWEAGETKLSKMSYAEKKKLFSGHLPNLQGFEFYKSGIFLLDPSLIKPVPPSEENFVPSWDWRDRHGYNYITSIKDQRPCASCWAFSPVSATEANANIYFNNPNLDYDLSEQEMIFSPLATTSSCIKGGFVQDTLSQLKNDGLVKEECMPYAAIDKADVLADNSLAVNKQYACQDLVKIKNYTRVLNNTFDIKYNLVTKGPLTFGIKSWWHFMTLVGYQDASLEPFSDQKFTVWILKNSWSEDENDKGYVKIVLPDNDRYGLYSVETDPALWQTNCEDKDGDEYCNWGFPSTAKPANCPASCKSVMDCNDANPLLGGFDNNYKCINIFTENFLGGNESADSATETTSNNLVENNSESEAVSDTPAAPVADTKTNTATTTPKITYGTDKNPSVEITVSNDGLATYTVKGVIKYYGTAKGCDQPRYFDPVIIRWGESATEITPTDGTFSATHKYSVKNSEYDLSVSVYNSCFQPATKHFTVTPKLK